MTDILMSIKPPYVDMLISGCKTVEIRKRAVRAPAGARIWIYATSPRRQVVASARLEAVAVEAPDEIWRSFGDRAGIDRREFDAYVGEAEVVAALTLTEITELDAPLCPRGEAPAFRPPQSYAFLHDAGSPRGVGGQMPYGTPANDHPLGPTRTSRILPSPP